MVEIGVWDPYVVWPPGTILERTVLLAEDGESPGPARAAYRWCRRRRLLPLRDPQPLFCMGLWKQHCCNGTSMSGGKEGWGGERRRTSTGEDGVREFNMQIEWQQFAFCIMFQILWSNIIRIFLKWVIFPPWEFVPVFISFSEKKKNTKSEVTVSCARSEVGNYYCSQDWTTSFQRPALLTSFPSLTQPDTHPS